MYYPSKSLVVVAEMKNRMKAQNQHRRMQFFNFLLICLEQVIRSYCHTLSGYCDLTVTHFQDTVILLSHTFRILWSLCGRKNICMTS